MAFGLVLLLARRGHRSYGEGYQASVLGLLAALPVEGGGEVELSADFSRAGTLVDGLPSCEEAAVTSGLLVLLVLLRSTAWRASLSMA